MNTTNEQSSEPAVADSLPGLDAATEPPTIDVEAQRLTAQWWERFNPRPVTPFVGQRTIVARLLKAGWEPDQVRDALVGSSPPITVARMESLLRNGGAARGRIVPVSSWGQGETYDGR